MDSSVVDFLTKSHAAAMVTLGVDGTPHAVRVGVALVGKKLWSSGTQDRRRTGNLRRDPRATLFVFDAKDPKSWSYLALETTVTILDGPEVGAGSLELFRVMQGLTDESLPIMWNGKAMPEKEFLESMSDERRLIYEFDVHKSYGMF